MRRPTEPLPLPPHRHGRRRRDALGDARDARERAPRGGDGGRDGRGRCPRRPARRPRPGLGSRPAPRGPASAARSAISPWSRSPHGRLAPGAQAAPSQHALPRARRGQPPQSARKPKGPQVRRERAERRRLVARPDHSGPIDERHRATRLRPPAGAPDLDAEAARDNVHLPRPVLREQDPGGRAEAVGAAELAQAAAESRAGSTVTSAKKTLRPRRIAEPLCDVPQTSSGRPGTPRRPCSRRRARPRVPGAASATADRSAGWSERSSARGRRAPARRPDLAHPTRRKPQRGQQQDCQA